MNRRTYSFLSGLMLLTFAIIHTNCTPLPFTLPVFVQIRLDPGGHVQFINLPSQGSFIVTATELAEAAQKGRLHNSFERCHQALARTLSPNHRSGRSTETQQNARKSKTS